MAQKHTVLPKMVNKHVYWTHTVASHNVHPPYFMCKKLQYDLIVLEIFQLGINKDMCLTGTSNKDWHSFHSQQRSNVLEMNFLIQHSVSTIGKFYFVFDCETNYIFWYPSSNYFCKIVYFCQYGAGFYTKYKDKNNLVYFKAQY